MSTSPDFSVILPTRGRGPHLRETLESALAARGRLEILIAHDRRPGEPPLEADALRDPRVRLIETEATGVSAARNLLMERATGRYLAFLDDDDVWLPEHLERRAATLSRFAGALMVGGDAFVFVDGTEDGSARIPDGIADLPHLKPGLAEGPVSLGNLILDNPFHPSTVLLLRERLAPADRFDPARSHMEDYDFWLRLARKIEPVFDARPTVVIRRHRRNASRDWRRMAEGSLQVLDLFLGAGATGLALSRREKRRRYGRLWHDLAYAHLVDDRVGDGRRALRSSMRRLPLNLKNYMYFLASILPEPARRAVFARGRRIREWSQPGPTEPGTTSR